MRNDWVMICSVEQVQAGAQKKLDYHHARLKIWSEELKLAEIALKESGMTFEDAAVTGGHNVRAVIDQTKSERYGECKRKCAKHQASVEEYERWLRALEYVDAEVKAVIGPCLSLSITDVQFFGL